MKPGPNFKLPRSIKVLLSNELDPHKRGSMRRDFIRAILENQVSKSKMNKGKKTSNVDIE
jgi:hypothetical protein